VSVLIVTHEQMQHGKFSNSTALTFCPFFVHFEQLVLSVYGHFCFKKERKS